MTYHSGFEYEFGDPESQDLISELKEALLYNRDFNREDSKIDCYTPGAYWLGGNTIDTLIYNLGMFLDDHLEKNCATKEEFDKYFIDAPMNIGKIALKVFDALGFKIIEDKEKG